MNVPPDDVTLNPLARLPRVLALLAPLLAPPGASGAPRFRLRTDPTTFVGLIPRPNVSPAEVRFGIVRGGVPPVLAGAVTVVGVAVVTFPDPVTMVSTPKLVPTFCPA